MIFIKSNKLFGTDGIRGTSNIFPMTADIALKLGQACGKYFSNNNYNGNKKIKVIIGKDTRVSGYIFEYALTSGLCSMGVDVYLVGPMPTPAIAHLVRSFNADFGIVISASHNPAKDNGIKFFDNLGYKLSDEIEEKIESMVFSNNFDTSNISINKVGKAFRIDDAAGRYIEFAKNSINNQSLKGLKIVLDCANGAAYKVAPLIFRELRAEVIVFANKPDGFNINEECGSLNPKNVIASVLAEKADIGICLDGDADRVILVDDKGEIVDGDDILALCAVDLKEKNELVNNKVVATVMSNLGFEEFLKNNNIEVLRTKVGDRYVIEEMKNSNIVLGGEQSGHIIFKNYNTTGDGTIATLKILSILINSNKKFSKLRKKIEKYPQILSSFNVVKKTPIKKLNSYNEILKFEKEIKNGRVLIRYSGTENKCRVMVEGKEKKNVEKVTNKISNLIKEEIGVKK
ncbi:MAG: phosphoglucosamine mutase [Nanoarchaeota archaeon]